MAKRRIVVLGSTGSIGSQTLDVVRQHSDKLEIVGLAAGSSLDALLAQAREFGVRHVAVGSEALADDVRCDEVRTLISTQPIGGHEEELSPASFGVGPEAVRALTQLPEADVVVNALVGAAGLEASYATLAAGKVLALANKESLVVGGDLIMPLAHALDKRRREEGKAPAFGPAGALMPIDSEHGAIYQCLIGEDSREVAKLWVTASGGPFRGKKTQELQHVTPQQALAHPTWSMGAKITIDSSTLMNKGLEVIEAHHLFAMDYDKIEVVVQPQSAIHSMVEFTDGSVKAHLGTTDMRIPIQYALSYPKRWSAPVAPLDFRTLGSLEFAAPDTDTFRCLALARHAGCVGGTLPDAMNAANEVAVAAFLSERIAYLDIARCVEAVMEAHEREGVQKVESLEQLKYVDIWAREAADTWCRRC